MAAAYEEFLRKMQEGMMMRPAGDVAEREKKGTEQPSPPSPLVDQQQQEQQQEQQQAVSPTFKELYDNICQEIRSSGTLDTVMQDFQVSPLLKRKN